MRFVIPSKGRSETIAQRTLRLVPDAIVTVAESEVEAYKAACPAKTLIVPHPDDVLGMGPIREWVVQNLSDGTVIMLDDDIHCVYDQSGIKKRRIEDPDHCQAILEATAIASKDSGARVFGYAQGATPMNYRAFAPFCLNTWVGGVVGVHGKELHFDTTMRLRVDIDFCLKSMMKDRIVWVDARYCWIHKRFEGSGGNNTLRTMERHREEMARLLKRWGKYLSVVEEKGATRLVLHVKR